jgi:excisionase family DNA binding protein
MEEPGLAAGWHLLSIREIADACQLSEKAVRRAIDDGELPAVKLRSRLRITPDDFSAWIDSGRKPTAVRDSTTRRRQRRPHPAGTFRALLQADSSREAGR